MADGVDPARVRGVLFDVDGTLVDSGYLHAISWWQALRRFRLDVPIATIHRAIGIGGDQIVGHILRESGQPDVGIDEDEARSAHDAIFSTHWPHLRPLPGARDLVTRCHRAGWTTVLASSAGSDELAVLREVLDVDEHLDHATAADDAERSKPAPDLVLAALEKAGLAAEDAVFVGDAVWDVRAAHDAGVPCVGVECGGTSAAELREAGAVATFKDPADLAAHWARDLG